MFILDNSASPQFNIEVKKKCSSNFFVLAYLSKLVEQIILEAPSNLILDKSISLYSSTSNKNIVEVSIGMGKFSNSFKLLNTIFPLLIFLICYAS